MGLNMGYKHDQGLVDAYKRYHNQLDETPKVDQKLRKRCYTIKKKVDFIKLVGLRNKWVIKQLYQEETCVMHE